MTRASWEPRTFQSRPEDSEVVGGVVGSGCSSGTAVAAGGWVGSGAGVGSGSEEPPQAAPIPTARNAISSRERESGLDRRRLTLITKPAYTEFGGTGYRRSFADVYR